MVAVVAALAERELDVVLLEFQRSVHLLVGQWPVAVFVVQVEEPRSKLQILDLNRARTRDDRSLSLARKPPRPRLTPSTQPRQEEMNG